MKQCRCVLCGEMIEAETQEDCIAHMQACAAFRRVHPEGGPTNPNGVYPEGEARRARATEPAVEVEHMSVKQLKRTISEAGLTHADCLEKSELRTRARQALARK